METLSQEQLAYIERHGKTKNPKTIAKDLKLELRHVQNALRTIQDPKPAAQRSMTPRFTTDGIVGIGFAIAIVVLGWLAYANNLAAGWHFDDFHTVLTNDAIREPTFAGIYQLNNYRQALYWVFAASWSLHKMDVRGWHIENNLIHVANGLLVYAFAFLTLKTPAASRQTRWPHLIAGLAGAIFVLHPVQTQAVTYITQRAESLCALLYLLAMVLYAVARVRRANGKATGSAEYAAAPLAAGVGVMILAATFLGLANKLTPFLVVSVLAAIGSLVALAALSLNKKADPIEAALFAGALLVTLVACETKEIAGTIPAAMLLWELVFMRPSTPAKSWLERARAHSSVLPYAAMLAFLPFLAIAVGLDVRLSFREGVTSVYDIKEVTGKQYVLTQLNVFATYTRLFLLPWGQNLDYDYVKRTGLFDGPTILSLVALLGTTGLALRVRKTQPVFTFAIFFMLGVLAPTSLFVLPDFIFEHRIYLPLAGAAFVSALLAERVVRAAIKDEATARKVLVAASVPLLAVLLVLTRSRNEAWANEETLWKDCHEKAKQKPRPLTNLGLFYQNNETQKVVLKTGEVVGGNFIDGAHPRIQKPDLWLVTTAMAGPRGRQFVIPKIEVESGPVELGGLERAEKTYLEALQCDDDYYKARNNYALCIIQRGILALENAQKTGAGWKQAEQDPRLGPTHPATLEAKKAFDHYDDEALALFKKGEAELLEIVRRHPDDHVTLMNLGNLYFGYLDRLDDAIAAVEKSISINDREPMAYAVMGEIYYSRGMEHADAVRTDAAKADYNRAIKNYEQFLSRAATRSPNYQHVLDRKTKAMNAIREGGVRAEPKNDGGGVPNPFGPNPGQNQKAGPRYKPGQRPK